MILTSNTYYIIIEPYLNQLLLAFKIKRGQIFAFDQVTNTILQWEKLRHGWKENIECIIYRQRWLF